jgi:hypothetical protein
MWIPTANFSDKFIFEHGDNPWIMYLLCHSFLSQVCKRIMPKLSLRIWTPRIQNSMYITFVNTTIFSIDYRRVGTQMLCFWTLLPEALPSLADDTALDAQAQTILTLLLLKTLWTASGWNHLRSLKKYCLLYLVVVPLLARLIHDHIVFHKPRL